MRPRSPTPRDDDAPELLGALGAAGIPRSIARPLAVDNDNATPALVVECAGDAQLPRTLFTVLYAMGFTVPEVRIHVEDGVSRIRLGVVERDGTAPEAGRRQWALDVVRWVTNDAERLPDAAE